MTQWQLLQGDVLLGELSEYGCDQPFFLARFTPGPGWERARGLRAASRTPWTEAPGGITASKVPEGNAKAVASARMNSAFGTSSRARWT